MLYTFRKKLLWVIKFFQWIAMLSCFLMVFIVSIDVILRKLTDARLSIRGSNELSAYLLVVVCMLSIPAMAAKDGHIRVDVLVQRLPPAIRKYWVIVIRSVECVVSVLFVIGSALKIQSFLTTGTTTDVLNMPKWPFAFAALIGFLELALLYFVEVISLCRGRSEEVL